MFRTARWGVVVAALAAPLASACLDLHTAEECQYIGTCYMGPPPCGGQFDACPVDGGDGGDASTDAVDEDGH
jgi:hypothetical protein